MKIQSFEYMQTMYGGNRDLEPDDIEERTKLLTKYKYSVIVEGGHLEFDNLYKWMKQNINVDPIKEIYYGKIDYDYGFAEFFIAEKTDVEKLIFAVQNIYTTYPNGDICKSNGSSISDIEYVRSDKNGIIYPFGKDL